MRRKASKKCCACAGVTPSFKCHCTCHNQEDCKYWEIAAFVWIYEAVTDEEREHHWLRFCVAYPEHALESCKDFWHRIRNTRWHHKHGHKYHHHHHPYHHHDHHPYDHCDN